MWSIIWTIVIFAFTELANGTGKSSTPASSSSSQSNVFYYRRKSPLATGNLTEEEVPIQRYRTYHRRRRNGLKLNSSHLFSRLPELFELTTIRTANTFSTMFDKNTTKKITELLNFTISAIENIRSETTTQFLGKKYTSKVILGKEYNGHSYGKSKDEFLTTDQKQKQLYFLKSLIQIYQKLMPNSSSSKHL